MANYLNNVPSIRRVYDRLRSKGWTHDRAVEQITTEIMQMLQPTSTTTPTATTAARIPTNPSVVASPSTDFQFPSPSVIDAMLDDELHRLASRRTRFLGINDPGMGEPELAGSVDPKAELEGSVDPKAKQVPE